MIHLYGKTPGRAGNLEIISHFRGLCLVGLLFLLLPGCMGSRLFPASNVREGPVGLEIGDVVATRTGEIITADDLLKDLSDASIVYVGEMHTNTEDHRVQLSILRKLYEEDHSITLGMEMFPRTAQPALDAYVRGEMTEKEFLNEIRWDKVWGFPYALYRGLMEFAREKQIRILGLNAPNDVVSKIGRNGLASLSPEERAQIARDFHLNDPRNRWRVQEQYNVHGQGVIKDFDSFYEAQMTWEETMAETLAQQLREMQGKGRILALIGRGHMTDRLGIPHLVSLRVPHEYKTIAPVPINYPFSTADPDLADYAVITDVSQPVHRPRLGVLVRPVENGTGLDVLNVIPDTPAAKADLRKGDVIITVDGTPVKNPEELLEALEKGGPVHRITIEREKRKKNIDITVH